MKLKSSIGSKQSLRSTAKSNIKHYINLTEFKLQHLEKELYDIKKTIGIENLKGKSLREYYIKHFVTSKLNRDFGMSKLKAYGPVTNNTYNKPTVMSGKDLDEYLKNPQYAGPYTRETKLLNQYNHAIPTNSMKRLCCQELMKTSSKTDRKSCKYYNTTSVNNRESKCGKYLDAYLKNPQDTINNINYNNETSTHSLYNINDDQEQLQDDEYYNNLEFSDGESDINYNDFDHLPKQSLCGQYLNEYFQTFQNSHMSDRHCGGCNVRQKPTEQQKKRKNDYDINSIDDTLCSCNKCTKPTYLNSKPNDCNLTQTNSRTLGNKYYKLHECQGGKCYQLTAKQNQSYNNIRSCPKPSYTQPSCLLIPKQNNPLKSSSILFNEKYQRDCKKLNNENLLSHWDRDWIAERGKRVVNHIKSTSVSPFEIPNDFTDNCRQEPKLWQIATKPKCKSKSKFTIKPYDPYLLFRGVEK